MGTTAVLLFVLWSLLGLGCALVLGWAAGRALTPLLPAHQRMLPPHVARALLLAGAILVLGPVGCRAGVMAGVIATGDASAGLPPRPLWPAALLADMRQDTTSVIRRPRSPGQALVLGAQLVAGDWWDIAQMTWPLLRHARAGHWPSTWAMARPDLVRAMERAVLAGAALALCLLAVGLLAATILLGLIRLETHRAPPPRQPRTPPS